MSCGKPGRPICEGRGTPLKLRERSAVMGRLRTCSSVSSWDGSGLMPQPKLNPCLHSAGWLGGETQEPVVLTGMELGESRDVEQQERCPLVSPSPGTFAGASQQEALQACPVKGCFFPWGPASSLFQRGRK